MKIDVAAVRKCLEVVRLQHALSASNWDVDKHSVPILDCFRLMAAPFIFQPWPRNADSSRLTVLPPSQSPDRCLRLKIDHQLTKTAREHFVHLHRSSPASQQVGNRRPRDRQACWPAAITATTPSVLATR